MKVIPTPAERPDEEEEDHHDHQTFTQGGLYTEAELAAWDDLITFPMYKRTLLTEISLGSCINENKCSAGTDTNQYDFSNLITNPILLT